MLTDKSTKLQIVLLFINYYILVVRSPECKVLYLHGKKESKDWFLNGKVVTSNVYKTNLRISSLILAVLCTN